MQISLANAAIVCLAAVGLVNANSWCDFVMQGSMGYAHVVLGLEVPPLSL